MRMTPSFIFAMVSLLMMPCVCGLRGQCRKMTSDSAKRVSGSTYAAAFLPSSVSCGLQAMTFMPMALRIPAVVIPILPRPMIPAVFPASSIIGSSQKQKSGHFSQRPSFTA